MTEDTRQRSGLTAITIENFKGIGAPVTVPLKPITLLFGANSAGKSTVIQALQYAWEVLENRNPDVDRTRLGGEVIDLGGFLSLVHKHEREREISITLHYSGTFWNDRYAPPEFFFSELDEDRIYDGGEGDVSFGLSVSDLSVRIATGWDFRTDRPSVNAYEVAFGGSRFGGIYFEAERNPKLVINSDHPFFDEKIVDEQGYVGKVLDLVFSYASKGKNASDRLTRRVLAAFEGKSSDEQKRFIEALQKKVNEGANDALEPAKAEEKIPRIRGPHVIPLWGIGLTLDMDSIEAAEYITPYRRDIESVLDQLLLGAGESVLLDLRRIRYLGPLREVPQRGYRVPRTREASRWATGLGAWDQLYRDAEESSGSSQLAARCNEYLRDVLGLGYTLRAGKRINLDVGGEVMAELRVLATRYEEKDGEYLLERVLKPLETVTPHPFVQLRDETYGIDVDPQDIGVGVSQTLPVVVGAVDPNCSIFAVEQPELHIHPRVQVNLADVFLIEFLLGGKNPRIALLETHSEHLVLRIMRRMRETHEGNLPPGIPPVRPEDVAVLYVEIVDGRTCIREMPLNERGELVKAWPGGFFEEALEETL